LVQAECLKDQFIDLVPENKIKVLYQAINCDEYDNPSLDEKVQGKILFMGHFAKSKGYTDLLKVIPVIVKKIPFV